MIQALILVIVLAALWIPRRALSRKQIAALSGEDLSKALLGAVGERGLKDIATRTRMSFDTGPPARMTNARGEFIESVGTYRERVRESEKANAREQAIALRANAESALYDSAAQKKQRAIDMLGANITPESIAAREKAEAERAERDRQRDLEGSGPDLSAVPYPMPPQAEWEKK